MDISKASDSPNVSNPPAGVEAVESRVTNAKTAHTVVSSAITFFKSQKALASTSTALQASNAVGYVEKSLIGLGSLLGIIAALIKIRKKNRFIAGLESLKKHRFESYKERDDFIKLLEKPENLAEFLSREFVTKHNIHVDRFFSINAEGKKILQLDLDVHNMIDDMIAQTKKKQVMDKVGAVIFIFSLAIFIASMATPVGWLTLLPMILFALAYVIEKKSIDNGGAPWSIEMFLPDFIKDMKNQSKLLKALELVDLSPYFNTNKAFFATYLQDEEMKILEEKTRKINSAFQRSEQARYETLTKEFSNKLKEMLTAKMKRDKLQIAGGALAAGGSTAMLAPIGVLGFAIFLPIILVGAAAVIWPGKVFPAHGNKSDSQSTSVESGIKSQLAKMFVN
jgi:dsDNA-binding SOS-regulon protein